MNNFYKRLSNKFINSPYISRWSVLIIDTIVATFATMSVYLVLGFFTNTIPVFSRYAFIGASTLVTTMATFLLFGTYRGIMRHTTIQEIIRLGFAVMFKSVVLFILFISLRKVAGFTFKPINIFFAQVADVLCSLALLVMLRMFLIYIYELVLASENKTAKRVFIYGDDAKAVSLTSFLSKNLHAEYRIMGFLKMQSRMTKLKLHGLTLYTLDDYDYFSEIIDRKNVNAIVFPTQHDALEEKDRLIEWCIKKHIKVLVLPQLNEMPKDGNMQNMIREIKIEDLLGRDEITINIQEVSNFLADKRVMVTGGAGSIGSELSRLISSFPVEQILVLDCAETPLHNIQLELTDKEKGEKGKEFSLEQFEERYKFIIADVRDVARMERKKMNI